MESFKNPSKLSGPAVYDFGDRALWLAEGLFCPLNPKYQKTKIAKSSLGMSYSLLQPGGASSLFYENNEFGVAEIIEIECWSSQSFISSSERMSGKIQMDFNPSFTNNSPNAVSFMKRFEDFLFGRD
eukprot:gene5646-7796_t